MATTTYYGTGRRKTSSARVFISSGSGKVTINNKGMDEYFGRQVARMVVKQPFQITETEDKFDVNITVSEVISDRLARLDMEFQELWWNLMKICVVR